jgi:hypothetical protein
MDPLRNAIEQRAVTSAARAEIAERFDRIATALETAPSLIQTKHYAIFFSPGTLFSEQSTREVSGWNPVEACAMAREITERYNSKPYGFRFESRLVSDDIDDGHGGSLRVEPKTVATSKMFHINAVVETLEQVEARNDPKEEILRSNMRANGWKIAMTTNSWKHCAIFEDGDCVVDADGNVTLGTPEPTPEVQS